ncbi:hypothetical protein BH24ACT5_BH24ACT5_05160 [soil metagenome]
MLPASGKSRDTATRYADAVREPTAIEDTACGQRSAVQRSDNSYGCYMGVVIVFETHSTSEDNERGVASGWADVPLSSTGQERARATGNRRRVDDLAAVFTSDLRRASESVAIAFADQPVPVLLDWRLRECDYGTLSQGPAAVHERERVQYIDQPYPGGESWREAVTRVARFFDDLRTRWNGKRVLIIGHVATRWALEHHINGVKIETLATSDFIWQDGWEFELPTKRRNREVQTGANAHSASPNT